MACRFRCGVQCTIVLLRSSSSPGFQRPMSHWWDPGEGGRGWSNDESVVISDCKCCQVCHYYAVIRFPNPPPVQQTGSLVARAQSSYSYVLARGTVNGVINILETDAAIFPLPVTNVVWRVVRVAVKIRVKTMVACYSELLENGQRVGWKSMMALCADFAVWVTDCNTILCYSLSQIVRENCKKHQILYR